MIQGKRADLVVVDEISYMNEDIKNILMKGEIGRVNGFTVHIDNDALPQEPSEYDSPADQQLYQNLRTEGFNKQEAQNLLKLMGIEPKEDPLEMWFNYMSEYLDAPTQYKREPKKKLPYYFQRRRF